MYQQLKAKLQLAYAPYSKVKVAALIITNDNNKYWGVNIENAAFSPTICAERNAIFQAVTAGAKKGDFKELHLLANTKNTLFPCGVCRQVMQEFFDQKTIIYLWNKKGNKKYLLADLFPYPMGSQDIKND